MTDPALSLSCQCGKVEYRAKGTPILTAVCYCDDCQEAARQIEALGEGSGPPVADADGGTILSLVRKDKLTAVSGSDLLRPHKLKPDSPTSRAVATCCNSAMYIGFDKGPFWVSAMHNRFGNPRPPIEMRIKTEFRTSNAPFPDDAPTYKNYPKTLVARLIWEWFKMKTAR